MRTECCVCSAREGTPPRPPTQRTARARAGLGPAHCGRRTAEGAASEGKTFRTPRAPDLRAQGAFASALASNQPPLQPPQRGLAEISASGWRPAEKSPSNWIWVDWTVSPICRCPNIRRSGVELPKQPHISGFLVHLAPESGPAAADHRGKARNSAPHVLARDGITTRASKRRCDGAAALGARPGATA